MWPKCEIILLCVRVAEKSGQVAKCWRSKHNSPESKLVRCSSLGQLLSCTWCIFANSTCFRHLFSLSVTTFVVCERISPARRGAAVQLCRARVWSAGWLAGWRVAQPADRVACSASFELVPIGASVSLLCCSIGAITHARRSFVHGTLANLAQSFV